MPAIGGEYNLLDLFRETLNNNELAKLYDMITETNEIVKDLIMIEANDGTGHKHAELTGLPISYYRALNQGYPKSKSSSKIVRDTMAKLGNRFVSDRALAKQSGNQAEYMARKERVHMTSVMEEYASVIFYGNSNTDSDKFMGTHIRLSVPSADRTDSGYNIIDGAGVGSDNASIIGVVHSVDTIHGVYPKGSSAEIQIDRFNDVRVEDDDGNKFVGHERILEQDKGLAVPSWHGLVRICNIDVSDLTADISTGADLGLLLSRAAFRMMNVPGKKAFYANATLISMLFQQRNKSVGGQVGHKEVDGKQRYDFQGIPIKLCDALLNTEATVSGTFSPV